MKKLLSTKEAAKFIGVNEKMIYTLISDKGLPATKVTGKWLFPQHLIEQWIEINTINYPKSQTPLPPYHGLLIIAGSNDIMLDKAISFFNAQHPEHIATFGNLGSMGGIRALQRRVCHMASSHLLSDDNEYNFDFALKELDQMPAVINFCQREQGILIQKGNPKDIKTIDDLAKPNIIIANRPLGTGTRLLLDHELKKAGIKGENIKGYQNLVEKHLDAGLEVLSNKADAAPGIRAVAHILDLDFISFRWERFDLMIPKDHFFDKGVQIFLGMFHEKSFKNLFSKIKGYDLTLSGKMVYPVDNE